MYLKFVILAAGIPDFRSPGSGLYHNLQKYNLPYPTAIFEMQYFYDNPKPFFVLAKELYPGSFKPTPCHYFVKLLENKGLLLRHYTQNIDTLERIAGIKDENLVEAHGTFYTNHCLHCHKLYTMEWMKEQIFNDKIPQCIECKGIVKPDIVFFGENLPDKFYELPDKDFKKCDLLIIMGTSLEVQPFASLIERVNKNCIRLLINREKVGDKTNDILSSWFLHGSMGKGLRYDHTDNTRDIAWIGNCDDGVFALTDALGWTDELKEMIKNAHKEIDEKEKLEKKRTNSNNDDDDDGDNKKEKTNSENLVDKSNTVIQSKSSTLPSEPEK